MIVSRQCPLGRKSLGGVFCAMWLVEGCGRCVYELSSFGDAVAISAGVRSNMKRLCGAPGYYRAVIQYDTHSVLTSAPRFNHCIMCQWCPRL